jgi:hypothetical protein
MNRKTNISALICLLVMAAAAGAQELPTAKPESVGLSSERLERIGTAVQHNIDDKRMAGAVTLVARRGHAVWFKQQGMADREAGKPMRADTIFRICSIVIFMAQLHPTGDLGLDRQVHALAYQAIVHGSLLLEIGGWGARDSGSA